MKKFSVVTLQVAVIFLLLVCPSVFLFASYANHMADLAVNESQKNAQNNLAHVENAFGLLVSASKTEALRISTSKDYITAVKNPVSYDQIIQDIDLKESISNVAHRLSTVQFTDDRLRNVYLYTLGTDYVLTSDRGILRLETLRDTGWLTTYEAGIADGDPFRAPFWAAWTVPETDLLSNGSHDGETPVISYISPVRIANSSHISLLVMNYYETKLAALINADKQNPVYLIDGQGRIICHPSIELLGRDVSDAAPIHTALTSAEPQGCWFDTPFTGLARILLRADETLYSYQRTSVGDWTLINENTLLTLTRTTTSLTRGYILALFALLTLGSLLCFYTIERIMRPIKRIFNALPGDKGHIRNEILLIEEKIHQMQQREQTLMQDMRSSQNDVKTLYLLTLLRDEPYAREAPVSWAYDGFIALAVQLDFTPPLPKNDALLSILLAEISPVLRPLGCTECVPFDQRTAAFIVNMPYAAAASAAPSLVQAVSHVKNTLENRLSLSFTTGIGLAQQGEENIARSFAQALSACRERMLRGTGQVILFEERPGDERICFYPKAAEQQLLNAVASCNRDALDAALARLRDELHTQPAQSIPPVFTRLAGALIAYLMERYDIGTFFSDGGKQWLAQCAAVETLDGLIALCREQAFHIVDCIESLKTQENYIDLILQYIAQHYTQDIDFEQMGAQIGISYSYMRRIVKDKTGQTLLDVVHQRRIEQAKIALKEPDTPVRKIALQLGYHNMQSFNRFFKKFVGVTPSEYRAIQN